MEDWTEILPHLVKITIMVATLYVLFNKTLPKESQIEKENIIKETENLDVINNDITTSSSITVFFISAAINMLIAYSYFIRH